MYTFTLQYNVTSFLIIINILFKYFLICKSYFKHILKNILLLRTCKNIILKVVSSLHPICTLKQKSKQVDN